MQKAKKKTAFPTRKKVSRTWRQQTFNSDRGVNEAHSSTSGCSIKSIMFHFGIRGCQVAIARKGELKTARSYTYAEPDYPDVTFNQTIRVASISKAITGTAITKLNETLPVDIETQVAQALLISVPLRARTTPVPTNPYYNGSPELSSTPLRVIRLLTHTGGWKQSGPGIAIDWESDTWGTINAVNKIDPSELGTQYQGLSLFPLHPALASWRMAYGRRGSCETPRFIRSEFRKTGTLAVVDSEIL